MGRYWFLNLTFAIKIKVTEIKINSLFVEICPYVSKFKILEDECIDILMGTDIIRTKLGLNIPSLGSPHLYLRDKTSMLQIESENRSVEDQVTSVVTSCGGNGVKQLSQDRIQSFSTLGTTEIAAAMNVNCLWGLSNLGQDGVKKPIDSSHSERKVEADVSSQLVVSAGVSLCQHKLSVAANSISPEI